MVQGAQRNHGIAGKIARGIAGVLQEPGGTRVSRRADLSCPVCGATIQRGGNDESAGSAAGKDGSVRYLFGIGEESNFTAEDTAGTEKKKARKALQKPAAVEAVFMPSEGR